MMQAASTSSLTAPHSDSRVASGDATVLTCFGIVLLAIFAFIVAMLPIDLAGGPAYVPSLFGP